MAISRSGLICQSRAWSIYELRNYGGSWRIARAVPRRTASLRWQKGERLPSRRGNECGRSSEELYESSGLEAEALSERGRSGNAYGTGDKNDGKYSSSRQRLVIGYERLERQAAEAVEAIGALAAAARRLKAMARRASVARMMCVNHSPLPWRRHLML